MNTYDPILEARKLEKGALGTTRPRIGSGTAHVLYGRHVQPLVLSRGGRLSLGESLFGGYTDAFVVDLSVKRLELATELPCRGDVHNFPATFILTCWVTDPKTVVQQNIRDAGGVLWSAVAQHAREVSRQYTLGDTTVAERAIADRLAGVVLHPAFATQPVEVRLAPDQQAVDIGRLGTSMTMWNGVVNNQLAAAHLATNPGDVNGALNVLSRLQQQYEESAAAYKETYRREAPEAKAHREKMLQRQAQLLGLRAQPELPTEGVHPVLPPPDEPTVVDEDEDD
jgi:hypothetical protein